MLYANGNGTFSALENVFKEIGFKDKNIEIGKAYLDLENERDDSLLKTVLPQDIACGNWQMLDKVKNALFKEVIKAQSEDLTARLLTFTFAVMKQNAYVFLYAFNTEDLVKLNDRAEAALNPYLGDKAKAAAFLLTYMYRPDFNLDLPVGLGHIITSLKRPETDVPTLIEAAKLCTRAHPSAPMVLCTRALDRIAKGENNDRVTVSEVCDLVLTYSKELRYGNPASIMLCGCAVGASLDPRLEEVFAKSSKGHGRDLAAAAASLQIDSDKVYDMIEKYAFDQNYLAYVVTLLPRAFTGSKERRVERLYDRDKAGFVSMMKNSLSLETAVNTEKIIAAYDKAYDPNKTDLKGAKQRELSKLIGDLFKNGGDKVRQYIMGMLPLDEVLPIITKPYTGATWRRQTYSTVFGVDDFVARAFTVMAVASRDMTYGSYVEGYSTFEFKKHETEGVKMLFGAGLGTELILETIAGIVNTYYNKENYYADTVAGMIPYADEFAKADASKLSAVARILYVMTLSLKTPNKYKARLLAACNDSSKAVRDVLATTLSVEKGWHEDIAAMLAAKKAAKRELALAAIEKQGALDYKAELEKAFETEKSDKLKAKIAALIGVKVEAPEGAAAPAGAVDIVTELTKGAKGKKVDWLFTTDFKPVKKTNGEVADEKYLKALLLSYASLDRCGVSATANELAAALDTHDLNAFAEDVFGRWIDLGAQAKTKWVLYFAAIHGGNQMVSVLNHYIKDWAEAARGAIAAEAARALALNGSPMAFMSVDNMSRKFKNKQVRAAAGEALRSAAEELGITTEELADKIVPDLGFGEDMSRTFDYGSRQFKVYITPALELEIFNGDKQVKSMPKPGAGDDKAKADAAYEEFKEMKKQMKAVVTAQKARLEYVMMCDRKWQRENWEKLFVKNPVMHSFAIGLIWGVYEDGKLKSTFRYMEDGSFNTADEEEFELPENAQIGLVHPIELSEEEKSAWAEQLSDYEITQPFTQLGRSIFELKENEKGQLEILRFEGKTLNSLSLIGKMTKLGWYKGEAEDAGWFYSFYREDLQRRIKNDDGTYTAEGFGAELVFSGASIVNYDFEGEEVTIERLYFFTPGTQRPSYWDKEKKGVLPVDSISKRYFSEIVMQLTSVFGSDEDNQA